MEKALSALERPTVKPIVFTGVERVRHDEDRLREARYWAERSIAERVIAGWLLADDDLTSREDHEPEKRTGITLRLVVRAAVDYVVVGGVAVNAHGFVIDTRDLDIFICQVERLIDLADVEQLTLLPETIKLRFEPETNAASIETRKR